MKRLDEIFIPHRARSDLFSRYAPGDVPYVGNGLADNAVVGLVTPLDTDRVFEFLGIAVSAFCEATVQAPPFVACGRAGNGLVVLEPRSPMAVSELAGFSAYLNISAHWRFSWYWQTTVNRLNRLMLPDEIPVRVTFDVAKHIPTVAPVVAFDPPPMKFRPFALGAIYDLKPGDHHSLTALSGGHIPVVSCGDLNNGICGHFSISKQHVYRNKLTIALNGSPLAAKYHPYDFAAKDDVVVCFPKQPLRLTTELFIQVMLGRERWRFSFYRKCYRKKLERMTVLLPIRRGRIDEDAIQTMMKATSYWPFLSDRLSV